MITGEGIFSVATCVSEHSGGSCASAGREKTNSTFGVETNTVVLIRLQIINHSAQLKVMAGATVPREES